MRLEIRDDEKITMWEVQSNQRITLSYTPGHCSIKVDVVEGEPKFQTTDAIQWLYNAIARMISRAEWIKLHEKTRTHYDGMMSPALAAGLLTEKDKACE